MINIFLISFLLSPVAMAKAYYAPKLEMIKEADAIAIVNITDTRSEKNQGRYYWFAKVATAEIEKSLKGNLPNKFEIYWDEDFKCANCKFLKGRQLVFLRKEAIQKWACSNWYLSVRPIDKDKIEWYQSNSGLGLSNQPLKTVIKDLETELAIKK